MQEKRKEAPPSKLISGLFLSLVAPIIYVLFIGPVLLQQKVNSLTYNLIGFAVFWILALAVLAYTLFAEKQSLKTIGWHSLSWKWIASAIGIGIFLSLLVPVFTIITNTIIPSSATGSIVEVTSGNSWWLILISVITAGITEEILFRGYPLERLLKSTGNKWLSVGVSLFFFVMIHATGWNLAHIIGVVIPLGLILTALYLWKRNLIFVIIIHIMIDLPLVFMALGT